MILNVTGDCHQNNVQGLLYKLFQICMPTIIYYLKLPNHILHNVRNIDGMGNIIYSYVGLYDIPNQIVGQCSQYCIDSEGIQLPKTFGQCT